MTSDADSTVFLVSFTTAQVDTRIVSVTRSTSGPSSTEATSFISHTAQHRVQPPRHAPQCLQLHCDQYSLEGHASGRPQYPGRIRGVEPWRSRLCSRKSNMPTADSSKPWTQACPLEGWSLWFWEPLRDAAQRSISRNDALMARNSLFDDAHRGHYLTTHQRVA